MRIHVEMRQVSEQNTKAHLRLSFCPWNINESRRPVG